MPLLRDIQTEWWMIALQTVRAHVPASLGRSPLASHCQAIQRGNGTHSEQNTSTTPDRKVDQFHQPPHRAMLQVNRRMISASRARIHHSGEKLGQHADGCACRVHPGGETRMLITHGMWQDMLFEEIKERFG